MRRAILMSSSFIIFVLIIAYLDFLPNLNLDSISKLHGLDYTTIFLILIAQSLLKEKNKYAFIFYIAGNLVNISLGYIINSPVIIAYSIVGIYIMAKNFIEWKKEEKNTVTS